MPQYKVLKPFSHKGKAQKKGDTLLLHEREARYLIMGPDPWVTPVKEATAQPKAKPVEAQSSATADLPAPKAPKSKKPDESLSEGGEVNA